MPVPIADALVFVGVPGQRLVGIAGLSTAMGLDTERVGPGACVGDVGAEGECDGE